MPVLVNSPLGEFLGKDPWEGPAAIGMGGYTQFSYRNHNTNCGAYSSPLISNGFGQQFCNGQ